METELSDTINRTATQQTLTVINDSKNKLLPRGILPGERKFNIVIYGIAECPNVTPRLKRHKSDLANCLSIVSKLNDEIRFSLHLRLPTPWKLQEIVTNFSSFTS